MSNLLQLLQEVDPAITPEMAADLRAVLVAINQEVEAERTSLEWSLNSWWQWLDDEGYNREAFIGALRRQAWRPVHGPACRFLPLQWR
jgi:hypothetical protein